MLPDILPDMLPDIKIMRNSPKMYPHYEKPI